MPEYVRIVIPEPRPLPPAPENPGIPFIRNRRIVAFYQNMIRRDRLGMPHATYGYYLRMMRYHRTK